MKRILIWLPLVALSGVGLALAVTLVRGLDPAAVATPLTGTAAPAFDAAGLDGAPHLTGEGLKGKPHLINFFASWCGPCAAENGVLLDLAKKSRVEIDGVALKDSPAALKAYLAARGNPYTRVGLDDTGRIAIDWGVSGVPETFAVDAGGTIVARHVGALKAQDAEDLVRQLDAAR